MAARGASRGFSIPGPLSLGLRLGLPLLMAAPAVAQRDLTDIPEPDPAAELAALKVADGWTATLFAADPDIAKPLQTNWDARGRLWVATSAVYPQLEPGEVADDKIVVLEDTDGDGRSDSRTVFADGLLIPTGVLPDADGNGAYVANSTELLYLRDTDGDGRADVREVVLDGFGTEDTHHILHTLRAGPAGAIYFNQSIYIHSQLETPHGLKRLDGGGIWRYEPDTQKLEVWARGFVNPWGHRFDEWGQEFATDGAYGQGVNYVFPGAAFVAAVGTDDLLEGLSPGQPKHCGLAILDDPAIPEPWRGRFVTADFRGHRVNSFEIQDAPNGSGYVARQTPDLLASDHVAFRPIDQHVGPDGAVYIADWYNPIIQHGEVDFRDPRRDRTHGRIWRLAPAGGTGTEKPDLVGMTTDELLDELKSPRRWVRDQAKRLLATREDAAQKLPAWVDGLEEGDMRGRLEALWLSQALRAPLPDAVDDAGRDAGEPLLQSDDARAVAAATRALGFAAERGDAELWVLGLFAAHPDARVRLEAVNMLRRIGLTADAAWMAFRALDHPLDENLSYALRLTARELAPQWLPAVEKDPNFFGDPAKLLFALAAAKAPAALPPALALWDAGELDADDRRAVLDLIGRFGDAPAADRVLAALDEENAPAAAALSALAAAARRGVTPAGGAGAVRPLLGDPRPAVAAGAAKLLGAWGDENAVPPLADLIEDAAAPDAVRAAAAGALAKLGDVGRAELDRLAATGPDRARTAATVALAAADPAAAAAPAAALLENADEDVAATLAAAFAAADGGPAALAAGLGGQSIPEPAAAAALRALAGRGGRVRVLEDALRMAGEIAPVKDLSDEQFAALVARARADGDPARGEAIYRREALKCQTCHAIGGAGGNVGPDMTSIGGSAQVDYLLESLLRPSAKIKEGYATTSVLTADGLVKTGVLVSETADALVLRDADGTEPSIPAGDVLEAGVSPVSLMPAGLVDSLRKDELADLTAFLSALGRVDGYRVTPDVRVRTWEVVGGPEIWEGTSRLFRANGVALAAESPDGLPWEPVYSDADGALPLADLPLVRFFGGRKFAVLRFGLPAGRPGAVTLQFRNGSGEPDAGGITAWVRAGGGGELTRYDLGRLAIEDVEGAALTVDVPAGGATVTLAVDPAERAGDELRVDLAEPDAAP